MARHPNPALIFVAAAAFTVATTIGIQVLAGPQQQQQDQQPPPAGQAPGQPIGGTGITQGEPNKLPPPNPVGTCADIPTADLCRLAPQAQDDAAKLIQQVAVDRQIIQNFGFDETVGDIERWEERGASAQEACKKEAEKRLLGTALKGLASAAEKVAPKLTSTRAISWINLLKRSGHPEEAKWYKNHAIDIASGNVSMPTFTQQFAEDADKIADGINLLSPEKLIDVADSTLTVAALAAPEFAPILLAIKEGLGLGHQLIVCSEGASSGLAIRKLTTVTEDKLKDLKKYSEQFKKDVDDLKRSNCILKAASAQNCSLNVTEKPKGGHGTAIAVGALAAGGAAAAGAAVALKGKSQSGACISTRNCIVSIFGGGCSCSQSTATGPCNWTGAVAQAGQSCGASVPCAQGLSCNNGVCEGPSGRCPF